MQVESKTCSFRFQKTPNWLAIGALLRSYWRPFEVQLSIFFVQVYNNLISCWLQILSLYVFLPLFIDILFEIMSWFFILLFKFIVINITRFSNSIKFDILPPYSTFLFLFISQESVLSCVFCIFAQIIIKI